MQKKKMWILLVFAAIFIFSIFPVNAINGDEEQNIEKKFKLQIQEDKQKGITTYMPKGMSIRSRIVLYFVRSTMNNTYFLRLRIAYFADEMLFIKQYVITADGKEYILPMRDITRQMDLQKMDIPDVYYDQEGGGICEYYDVAMQPQEIEIMRQICISKSAKMKYIGTKGNQKVKIHKAELKDIKLIFDAFDAFKAARIKSSL